MDCEEFERELQKVLRMKTNKGQVKKCSKVVLGDRQTTKTMSMTMSNTQAPMKTSKKSDTKSNTKSNTEAHTKTNTKSSMQPNAKSSMKLIGVHTKWCHTKGYNTGVHTLETTACNRVSPMLLPTASTIYTKSSTKSPMKSMKSDDIIDICLLGGNSCATSCGDYSGNSSGNYSSNSRITSCIRL